MPDHHRQAFTSCWWRTTRPMRSCVSVRCGSTIFANELVWVKDGAEALDFLFHDGRLCGSQRGAHTLKVILLDLRLPKVDGLEVLRRIRADERTRKSLWLC